MFECNSRSKPTSMIYKSRFIIVTKLNFVRKLALNYASKLHFITPFVKLGYLDSPRPFGANVDNIQIKC